MRNYTPWLIVALLVSSTSTNAAPANPVLVPGGVRSWAIHGGTVCLPATRNRPDPSHFVASCPGSARASHSTLETRSRKGVAGLFTRFARLFATLPSLP